MSTILWIVFASIYVLCFALLGLATLRKGHYAMFWLGIIFPVLWVIGAFMAPTPTSAVAREEAQITGAP
jgi:hypothetical protein